MRFLVNFPGCNGFPRGFLHTIHSCLTDRSHVHFGRFLFIRLCLDSKYSYTTRALHAQISNLHFDEYLIIRARRYTYRFSHERFDTVRGWSSERNLNQRIRMLLFKYPHGIIINEMHVHKQKTIIYSRPNKANV